MSAKIGDGYEARAREERKALYPRVALTPRQIATAKSEREAGMSWAELGRRFGKDGSTVRIAVEASHD